MSLDPAQSKQMTEMILACCKEVEPVVDRHLQPLAAEDARAARLTLVVSLASLMIAQVARQYAEPLPFVLQVLPKLVEGVLNATLIELGMPGEAVIRRLDPADMSDFADPPADPPMKKPH